MKLRKFRKSRLALWFALYFFMSWNSTAMAGLVGSALSDGSNISRSRIIEIEKIQKALENKVVVDKLSAYGMHPDEIKNKLSRMSDDQVHLLAQASDDVLAGGDGIGFVIGVLVIVLLVIVILKLLNKEIIIR